MKTLWNKIKEFTGHHWALLGAGFFTIIMLLDIARLIIYGATAFKLGGDIMSIVMDLLIALMYLLVAIFHHMQRQIREYVEANESLYNVILSYRNTYGIIGEDDSDDHFDEMDEPN